MELIRHPKVQISEHIIENFFKRSGKYPGKGNTDQIISGVWSHVFNRWTETTVNVFMAMENSDYKSLCDIYENYYVNGTSEGASSGRAFNDEASGGKGVLYRNEKALRNENRARTLGAFYGVESTNLIDIYNEIFTRVRIPDTINSGQTWGWKSGDRFVHFELADYVYFLEAIKLVCDTYNITRTCFIGDGSGVLSTLVYNNIDIEKSIHIDLAHFLLKQYLNSPDNTNIHYVYAESFTPDYVHDAQLLINQDSFPEMTPEQVTRYIDNIVMNKTEYIFSYNKNVTHEGGQVHADWESIVVSRGFELISSTSETMRPGYSLKLFKKVY